MDKTRPTLNLLTDPVFPVRALSGARRWVCFSELMDEQGDTPVSFAWPRADLNIASAELAVGLLCLIHRPTSHAEWQELWGGGKVHERDDRIRDLAALFNLLGDAHGDGPRFCQDYESLDGEANDVESLFIDTPGGNGQKKNADLMTHRNRYPALGLKAAAMALYGLQQFAPAGGAGNRTSLRGGGPMTTLVMPWKEEGTPVSLARLLLLNVPLSPALQWLDDSEIARALPWLKPTITSDGTPEREVSEADQDVHALHAFFGMPRRIRLVADGFGACPITGEEGPLVTGFIQKPWGFNYTVWRHPLTPYRQKKDQVAFTVKPKPRRFGYRDWVGITVGRRKDAEKAFPAQNVEALTRRTGALRKQGLDVRLLAAGWAMNNMEAESFLYSLQPLYLSGEGEQAQSEGIASVAVLMADAGDAAAGLLRRALNEALFGGKAKSTDSGLFEDAAETFFAHTEDEFHALLAPMSQESDGLDAGHERLSRNWLACLRAVALAIFDEHASGLLKGRPDVKLAGRVAAAYRKLAGELSTVSKLAKDLGIPQPVAPKGRGRTSSSTKGGA